MNRRVLRSAASFVRLPLDGGLLENGAKIAKRHGWSRSKTSRLAHRLAGAPIIDRIAASLDDMLPASRRLAAGVYMGIAKLVPLRGRRTLALLFVALAFNRGGERVSSSARLPDPADCHEASA